MAWEVSLPDPRNAGTYVASDPMTYQEALKIAQTVWGADEEGRIHIVNCCGDEDEADCQGDDFCNCGCNALV